jgi:hypothetical protein
MRSPFRLLLSLQRIERLVQYFLSMPPYFSSMEKSDNGRVKGTKRCLID